jgi:hypothetical protein
MFVATHMLNTHLQMEWSTLPALLRLFDHTKDNTTDPVPAGVHVSSSRTTACAAPALINICLAHVRIAKAQQQSDGPLATALSLSD